jgi:hypothetical protein
LLNAPPDGNHLIRLEHINVAVLANRFSKVDDPLTLAVGPFSAALQSRLDQLKTASPDAQPPAGLAAAMANQLNEALRLPGLDQKIDDSKVMQETKAALSKQPHGIDLLRFNRALLSEAYPDEITPLSHSFYSHLLIKALGRLRKHPS